MKDKLTQIETQLRNFIERHSEKFLGDINPEQKLVEELIEQMENNIRVHSNIGLVAPNNFILNVASQDLEDIRANQYLLDELAAQLMMAGESAGLIFGGRITISVFPDESLNSGDFELIARWKETETSETVKIPSKETKQRRRPPTAFVIVGGSKIFAIEEDVTTVGRKLNNDLVLDDPRVSRNHCELRVFEGHHKLIDMDSSGGTYINGRKINEEILQPGDVISVAGVPLVYGQDAIRAVTDSQAYQSPKSSSVDVTAGEDVSELDLDTFEE